jgi:hypothetical protein
MKHYDPEVGPDPKQWLGLDEGLRHVLVQKAHEHPPPWHPKARADRAHVIFHTIVENQVASGDPPETARALERLLGEGLGRHDAIHALASVLATETHRMLRERRTFDQDAYLRSLADLSAATWRHRSDPPD